MILYLSIYIILVTIGLFVKKRSEHTTTIVILIFLLWFMGGRYYVGNDYYGYMMRFENMDDTVRLSDIYSFDEGGFRLLVSLIKNYGLDYVWLNVLASAIILIGYYVMLKNIYKPLMVLALSFPVLILQLGMSGIRQGIAVSILMIAFTSFINNKKTLYVLWVILASQFHTSAIMFLPLVYLIDKKVTNIRMILAFAILAPVSIALLGDRVDVYQNRYVDQIYGEVSAGGVYYRYLLILIPSVLFFKNKDIIRKQFSVEYNLLLLFSIMSIVVAPLGLVSTVILHRMIYYLMPVSIISFVYVTYYMSRCTGAKYAMIYPAIIYGVYSASWFILSRHALVGYMHYRNYFIP